MKHQTWLLGLLFVFSGSAQAQWFQKEMFKERRTEKEATQWNLADYLSQKKQMSVMDLWLAQNRSKNIIDLALVGGTTKFDIDSKGVSGTSSDSDSGVYYSASLYAFMVGVQAEVEKIDPDRESTSASANIRLLGAHLQSTNLLVKYGIQKLKDNASNVSFSNPYFSAELTLYAAQFVGLYGGYKSLFSKTNDRNIKLEGHSSHAGLFLESGFIRIFGEMFQEELSFTQTLGKDEETRKGHRVGLGLYF